MLSFLIAESLLKFFGRTRRLDLFYVGKRLNILTTVPPDVPRLQDRQTGKTAEDIQHVWRKVNSPTFAIPSKIYFCFFS